MGRCVLLALLLASSLRLSAQTAPFVLEGVDFPELRQDIHQELCQAWADAEALLRGERPQIVKPLVVEISFTRKRFSLPGLPPRWQAPTGCIYFSEGRAVLRLDKDLSLRSRQIIRHEVAHWVLWLYWTEDEPLPTWLDEGIACLLEMPLTPDGRPQMQPERRRQFLQLCKRRKSAVRLERLLSPERRHALLTSNEYAYSWALAYYLASQNTALLDLLQANRTAPGQHLQQHLFQLAKPPVTSHQELLRQIQAWMEETGA